MCNVPESWILSGQLTLTEIHALKSHGLTEADVLSQVPERRRKFNAMVGKRFPSLVEPAKDWSSVISELATMRDDVHEAFLMGQLTLIQARFAQRTNITGEKFAKFRRVNDIVDEREVRDREIGSLCQEYGLKREEILRRLDAAGSIEKVKDDLRRAAMLTDAEKDGRIPEGIADTFRRYGTPTESVACYLRVMQAPRSTSD